MGREDVKKEGLVLEEFQDFNNLHGKIKLHIFGVIRYSGECIQKISENERICAIMEIKLLRKMAN